MRSVNISEFGLVPTDLFSALKHSSGQLTAHTVPAQGSQRQLTKKVLIRMRITSDICNFVVCIKHDHIFIQPCIYNVALPQLLLTWFREFLERGVIVPRHERNLSLGCSTRSNTNQAVQPQKMVRSLIFWIKNVEGLYYLCSENKGTDQLRNYCRADDLRLCFCIGKKQVFSSCGPSHLV